MHTTEKISLALDLILIGTGLFGLFTNPTYIDGVCLGMGLCSLIGNKWR